MTLSLQLNNEKHKYLFHSSRKSQRLILSIKRKKNSSEMGEAGAVAKKTQHHKQTNKNPTFFSLLKIQAVKKKKKTEHGLILPVEKIIHDVFVLRQ